MGSRARHSTGRKAGSRPARKSRPVKTSRRRPAPATVQCPEDSDPLLRLSAAIALVETIEVAMRTQEDDPELGPICVCLELARKQLARAHSAVDLALQGVRT